MDDILSNIMGDTSGQCFSSEHQSAGGRLRFFRGVRQLVMADSCLACGRMIGEMPCGKRICGECDEQLQALAAAVYCPQCGHGMAAVGSCAVCAAERPPAGNVARVGAYEGLLAEMVRRLKFGEAQFLLPPLAQAMFRALDGRGLTAADFDVATAIPLHWWHYWRRGYNQSWLLLKHLQRLGLGVPCRRLLLKVRHTRPQVGLSGEARRKNVRGSFAVRPSADVRGQRVLLVDDVLTTGATAGACVRQLKKAGAADVVVLVAAVAGVNYKV